MPRQDGPRVTLAQIARITGLSRPAVSNWRKRHDDFPKPVGGTDTSPEFLLDDVDTWLRAHDKLPTIGHLQRLWSEIESLGARTMSAAVIAAAARPLTPRSSRTFDEVSELLTPEARQLAERALDIAEQQGADETIAFLTQRWLPVNARQPDAAPPLAHLMASVACLVLGQGDTDSVTVLDPSCGTAGLLLAAAQWIKAGTHHLVGVEDDAASASVGAARLAFRFPAAESNVFIGNSLRADPCPYIQADIVISVPPWNERDWNHERLATDPRWTYGLPPRGESELAWIQHALARLRPGGVAVLMLPPAVASRRTGRRIRAELVRSGVLKSVIALPPGMAPPYGVALALWVLQAPTGLDSEGGNPGEMLFVDATALGPANGARAEGAEWIRVVTDILGSLSAALEHRGQADPAAVPSAWVPVLDLLDDQVDLSPTRHVPVASAATGEQLGPLWLGFGEQVAELGVVAGTLERLRLAEQRPAATTTVGDLENAGALTVSAGAAVDAHGGEPPEGAVSVLTISALRKRGQADLWIDRKAAEDIATAAAGPAVVRDGDVVVAGTETTGPGSWVHQGEPMVLGAGLFAIGHDPRLFDPWFLAGCLGAVSNLRRASSRATTSTRIDIRRLAVLRLPLSEQRAYGEAFRQVERMRQLLASLSDTGERLVHDTSELLVAGRLEQP